MGKNKDTNSRKMADAFDYGTKSWSTLPDLPQCVAIGVGLLASLLRGGKPAAAGGLVGCPCVFRHCALDALPLAGVGAMIYGFVAVAGTRLTAPRHCWATTFTSLVARMGWASVQPRSCT